MKRLLVLATVVVSLSACGGPQGYNDSDTLAASVQSGANTELAATGGSPLTVICVQSAPQVFDCIGRSATATAHQSYVVSVDGTSYVPKVTQ